MSSLSTSSNKRLAPSPHVHAQSDNADDKYYASFGKAVEDRSCQIDQVRSRLAQLQAERDNVASTFKKHNDLLLHSIRPLYLQAVCNCHGVELELRRIQQEIIHCERQHETIQDATETIQKHFAETEQQCNERTQVFAAHQIKRELYVRQLQIMIQERRDATTTRETRRSVLTEKQGLFANEEIWSEEQLEQAVVDTKRLEAGEENEDEIIHQLARNVKSCLAKVRA
jgi:hypothetical protein